MAYRGPNVQVIQNFEPSPAEQTPEDLPVALAGSAYAVYAKENLGAFRGLGCNSVDCNEIMAFVNADGDKVIYAGSQNQRVYDRYPPRFFLDLEGSNELVNRTVAEAGVTMKFGATFAATDKYTVKEVVDALNAWIPMFWKTGTTVFSVSGNTITLADASVKLKTVYGIVDGLPVYSRATGGTAIRLGAIASVLSETEFVLDVINSAYATEHDEIFIGFNPDLTLSASHPVAADNVIAYLYDANGKFNSDVRIGDVIELVTANSIIGTNQPASVRAIISDNLLQLHVSALTIGEIQYTGYASLVGQNLNKLFGTVATATAKAKVIDYTVHRLAGFTRKLTTTDVVASGAGTTTLALSVAQPLIQKDDVIVLRDGSAYKQTVTVEELLNPGTDTQFQVSDTIATGVDEAVVWLFKDSLNISNPVFADYRAATALDTVGQILNVADNIASLGDLSSVYNDLGTMVSLVKTVSAKMFYFTVVDPTLAPATAYAAALALYELRDIYDIVCGSDDVAVQALLPGHVEAQSDPYEAHERIAVQALNELDVYGISIHTGGVGTTGLVTCAGADLAGDGIGIGDDVIFPVTTTATGVVRQVTAKVTGSIGTITLQTDWIAETGDTAVAAVTIRFLAGTTGKKALKAKLSLGAADNRRISAVFPPSFDAVIDGIGTVAELPGYYLACVVVGQDMAFGVAQSQTRGNVQLPWQVSLGTNFVFKKSELDLIGEGGVYIFMQPQPLTNVVYCRHDLTTNMDAIEYRERSITKQADKSAKFLRAVVNPYVGRYNITPELLRFLMMILSTASQSLMKNGIVQSCAINSVTRDPNIADKILINITIIVFVAGNYYEITLNVRSR